MGDTAQDCLIVYPHMTCRIGIIRRRKECADFSLMEIGAKLCMYAVDES